MEENKVKYLFRELNHEGEDGVGYNWLVNASNELEDHKETVYHTSRELDYRNGRIFDLVQQYAHYTFKNVVVEFGGDTNDEFYINLSIIEPLTLEESKVQGEDAKGRLIPAYTYVVTVNEDGTVHNLHHLDKWVMTRDKNSGKANKPAVVGKVDISNNYADNHEAYNEDGLKEWFGKLFEYITNVRV